MLILTRKYDLEKCISLRNDQEALTEYINSLMPERFKHVDSLLSNQRYFINCDMYTHVEYSIEIRRELSDALMHNVRVAGYIGDFVTVQELETYVSNKAVNRYKDKEYV